ncbi:Non-specific lipid-transfer protein [Thalictrum thalictroides]|uniref:Non-specific lipid-transfer protein n=1 Tax=Thalictrum thalictroides TaxID=46969 RepID=A0A7J6WK68_THATH|nr:Non-specific lipid-transfer protein [Thalictrum thalictroides]
MKGVMIIGFLLVVCMVEVMFKPIEAFSCEDVTKKVTPCYPYATGAAPEPSPVCCNGVKQLKTMGATSYELCNCLKTITSTYPNLKNAAVVALPTICGVSFPFTVSKTVDCNK